MKNLRFKPYPTSKNPQVNHERKMCLPGKYKNDLSFFTKNNYTPINKTSLMNGILVGYRLTSPTSMFDSSWTMQTCYHSQEEQKLISDLIYRSIDLPASNSYDFFIMDGFGNILFTNCLISKTIDENGIFHLSSQEKKLDYFIYPAPRKKFGYKLYYCCGETFEELNNHINLLIDKKLISKPKNFKKGFTQTQESTLTGIHLE